MRGTRGRALQRQRSERVERSFAHTCETGGARRTWLRGFEKILKRYTVHVAGRNLGLLMRMCFELGTPRSLQGSEWDSLAFVFALRAILACIRSRFMNSVAVEPALSAHPMAV